MPNRQLIAKPVVENQLWIITDGNSKVGNVTAETDGYEVKINGDSRHYASTKVIERSEHIKFLKMPSLKPTPDAPEFANWPTGQNTVYNSVFDVSRKIHMFTKTPESKCQHCAGWFALQLNGEWEVQLTPKAIYVNRYPYHGPFQTKREALNSLKETCPA